MKEGTTIGGIEEEKDLPIPNSQLILDDKALNLRRMRQDSLIVSKANQLRRIQSQANWADNLFEDFLNGVDCKNTLWHERNLENCERDKLMTQNERNFGINRMGKDDPKQAKERLIEEIQIYESLNRLRDQKALQVGFQRLRMQADERWLENLRKLLVTPTKVEANRQENN